MTGTGQDYSRDESVGAWVLHSQQYAKQKIARLNQELQKEPLYAVCNKNGGTSHYATSSTSPKKVPLPVVPPVVLREPPVVTTEHAYSEHAYVKITQPPYVQQPQQQHCHQYPPHHMANLKKRAPPPPRRSEKTHLTTTS